MYSKETEHLKLPQWEPKDHPDFLTDINDAFKKVDAFAGSMEFINEPVFNDVVTKQNQLAADMQKVQDDLKILDTEEHELEKRISTAEDRIQHEHETNDKQDTQIENIQTDLHNETVRAQEAETNLQTNINKEVERAQTTEGLLQENINIEVQRATAAEEVLQTAIEGLNSSTDELSDRINNIEENEPDLSEYLTKSEAEKKYAPLDGVLSAITELTTGYNEVRSKNTEQDTKITSLETRVSTLEEGGSGGDTGDYLTKTEASDIYATKNQVDLAVGALGQTLNVQMNRISEVETKVTDLEENGGNVDLSDYITKTEFTDQIKLFTAFCEASFPVVLNTDNFGFNTNTANDATGCYIAIKRAWFIPDANSITPSSNLKPTKGIMSCVATVVSTVYGTNVVNGGEVNIPTTQSSEIFAGNLKLIPSKGTFFKVQQQIFNGNGGLKYSLITTFKKTENGGLLVDIQRYGEADSLNLPNAVTYEVSFSIPCTTIEVVDK